MLLSGTALMGQEICNNAIDDDGDGLIDLNDEDCLCEAIVPSSLIPNPSFEDQSCCPTENARLDCANGWIQASAATSDYVHTCGGFLGNSSIPAVAPLPFPDGEGGVGFRDGQEIVGPNYKEYVGACLLEPMVIGETYRLDFFVGFQADVPGSMELDLALFGSSDCRNLPFGNGDFDIGCPLNAGGYELLNQVNVRGNGEWVNVNLEFTADQAYEVIVFGPKCEDNPSFRSDPYFYLDGLSLANVNDFGLPLSGVTGSICEEGLTFSFTDDPTFTYQWYRNGIAIIGETSSSLTLTIMDDLEGVFEVAVNTPQGCTLSQGFEVEVPPYYEAVNAGICDNEVYVVGDQEVTEPGYQEIQLVAADGCDSIVQLTLEVFPTSSSNILNDTICEGDIYQLYDIETTIPGTYETTIPNVFGCDSLITVDLFVRPPGQGLELGDDITIELGEEIDLKPAFVDPSYVSFIWTDVFGTALGSQSILPGLRPFSDSLFFLSVVDRFGCGTIDSIQILVDKSNIKLFVPNIFSPNLDGANDNFRFYAPPILARVENFRIFNRWGGLVYEEELIKSPQSFKGWNGQFNGREADQGVYVYSFDAIFIDGTTEFVSGGVTLIR